MIFQQRTEAACQFGAGLFDEDHAVRITHGNGVDLQRDAVDFQWIAQRSGHRPAPESLHRRTRRGPWIPDGATLVEYLAGDRTAGGDDVERLVCDQSAIPQVAEKMRRPLPLFSASEPSGLRMRRPKALSL